MIEFVDFQSRKKHICVVGLGYVGLPLAVSLASEFSVIGFDINDRRITDLNDNKYDETGEISDEELKQCGIRFTTDSSEIASCHLVIVTVPTPIDENNQPDLSPIVNACETVGQNLANGAVVIFESTVYPGVTEQECVPILESQSGAVWKTDFFVGYSPERINPGDKVHTIEQITKVVAGDTAETTRLLVDVYGAIIKAGVHTAESIQVAEAAKVIENTQRDLNIALMNELAIIFGRLHIDTHCVLQAAGTKWNFLPFKPGLVGGHCIGVDPYYLTHRAERSGYYPQMILAGRRINDGMGKYIAEQTVKHLVRAGAQINQSRVLMLGLTFKENVPDIRNSKVIDIIDELTEYHVDVCVHDPLASPELVKQEFGVELMPTIDDRAPYDAVIVAVKHDEYRDDLSLDRIESISRGAPIIMDVKWLFEIEETKHRGFSHWRL